MNNYEFCADFARTLVPIHEATVLDYGCGAGLIVALLRRSGIDAFGCDVFYDDGRHRGDVPADLIDARYVREMPDDRIPFADATFDLVVSNQVFEHVPDLDAALDEIRRVLKPGGVLLFLFPDRAVWREGHCGIPFLHWFPKGSRVRLRYAGLLRAAGFGYFKGDKSVRQWTRHVCDWLDRWTYYRPYDELRRTFDARFIDWRHHERFWLLTRFGERWRFLRWWPSALQQALVRKWAGMIGTCRKPG